VTVKCPREQPSRMFQEPDASGSLPSDPIGPVVILPLSNLEKLRREGRDGCSAPERAGL
jgi:hypothetical protein